MNSINRPVLTPSGFFSGESRYKLGDKDKQSFHVYESRGLLTLIAYLFHKYLPSSEWVEHTLVNNKNEKCRFLVLQTDLNAISKYENKLFKANQNQPFIPLGFFPEPPESLQGDQWKHFNATLKTLVDDGFLNNLKTKQKISFVEITEIQSKAAEAIEEKTIAIFALHLQTIQANYQLDRNTGDLISPRAILELYDAFLRGVTNTPPDEFITMNQLHIKSLDVFPLNKDRLISNMEKTIKLLESGTEDQQKKVTIFERTLEAFKADHDGLSDLNVRIHSLKDPQQFGLENRANFLNTPFNPNPNIEFECVSEIFDYIPPFDANTHTNADFSNAYLGGGAFTHGAFQEEIFALESSLALILASFPSPIRKFWCALSTRNPKSYQESDWLNRHRINQGSPDPLYIEGLQRFLEVKGYGNQGDRSIYKNPINDLDKPVTVNILAAAAAKIEGNDDSISFESLGDAAAVIAAEFVLHIECAQDPTNPPPFSSGKLGCGAFKNDIIAMYLIQRLLAQHYSIPLILYAYSAKEEGICSAHWDRLNSQFNEPNQTIGGCIEAIAELRFKITSIRR